MEIFNPAAVKKPWYDRNPVYTTYADVQASQTNLALNTMIAHAVAINKKAFVMPSSVKMNQHGSMGNETITLAVSSEEAQLPIDQNYFYQVKHVLSSSDAFINIPNLDTIYVGGETIYFRASIANISYTTQMQWYVTVAEFDA